MKKVSYCSVCYGRLWQLAFTLKDNLENLKDDEELVLVDYNSPDDTMLFVLGTKFFEKYIQENKLKFIKILNIEEYNCPKSKNISHRLASGGILVNLDVDNYLLGMRDKIDKTFNKNDTSILHMFNESKGGTFGRIALTRNMFYKLGGYDEQLLQHAHQDSDLIERGKGIGLEYVLDPLDTTVIPNNLYTKNRYLNQDWFDMKQKNIQISEKNLINKQFVANKKYGWGNCSFIENYDKKINNYSSIFP
jgi:hypothetical protein